VDEAVTLRALTSDIDLEDIDEGDVTWVFAGDTLGTGTQLVHTFTSAESGTLSVTAVDGSDAEATESITLNIDSCTSSPPSIASSWPEGDLTVLGDEDAHFQYDMDLYKDLSLSVTVTDPEDGTLTGSSVVWTTDKPELNDDDPVLAMGSDVNVRLYGDGCFGSVHVVTVTATDSDGLSRSATFVVRVSGNLC
jgi:hypothetical protein